MKRVFRRVLVLAALVSGVVVGVAGPAHAETVSVGQCQGGGGTVTVAGVCFGGRWDGAIVFDR